MKKKSFFSRLKNYFKEVVVELKKVVWPSWDSVKSNTVVVIVSVLIAAFVLGFIDMALAKVMSLIV